MDLEQHYEQRDGLDELFQEQHVHEAAFEGADQDGAA